MLLNIWFERIVSIKHILHKILLLILFDFQNINLIHFGRLRHYNYKRELPPKHFAIHF